MWNSENLCFINHYSNEWNMVGFFMCKIIKEWHWIVPMWMAGFDNDTEDSIYLRLWLNINSKIAI